MCPSLPELRRLAWLDLDSDAIWHSAAFCAVVTRETTITLNEEHDSYRWISESDVDRHFMWPSEKPLLAEICRELLRDSLARPRLRIELKP